MDWQIVDMKSFKESYNVPKGEYEEVIEYQRKYNTW